MITLDHGINTTFSYIDSPKKVANLLRDKKAQFESKSYTHNDSTSLTDQSYEKFDILVETLGEVIKEYMDKDTTKRNNPDKRSM